MSIPRLFALIALAATSALAQVQVDITLSGKTLDVRRGAELVASYPISPGVAKHPTPKGNFTIRKIVWNPPWTPPNEKWAKGKKPAPPNHPQNPMKVVKIFFNEPDYYIHGTADEKLLGDAASHGCIRLSSADAYALARLLMENGGAAKPPSWYQSAISGQRSTTVILPRPAPVRIGA